jgi:hypothetical protein
MAFSCRNKDTIYALCFGGGGDGGGGGGVGGGVGGWGGGCGGGVVVVFCGCAGYRCGDYGDNYESNNVEITATSICYIIMIIIIIVPSLMPVDIFKFLGLDKFCLTAVRKCSSLKELYKLY